MNIYDIFMKWEGGGVLDRKMGTPCMKREENMKFWKKKIIILFF